MSRPRQDRNSTSAEAVSHVRLFGIHAVEAALANHNRTLLRLSATENAANRLSQAVQARSMKVEFVPSRDLSRMLGPDAVHQGALLEAEPLPVPTLEQLVKAAGRGRPLVVLDQVTDPHNVGAILRTAAVFNACGLLLTRRNSPPLDGVLAKAASGALEHVPVLTVPNLAQALSRLSELGIWCVGLDGEADDRFEVAAGPLVADNHAIALVLGAEGRGLRQLTRQRVQQLCRLTTTGPLQSLNVSNAAAVALHVLARASET